MNSPEGVIHSVEKICDSFHIDALLPQIRACKDSLKEEGIVNVVVLGRFKAGKSSFLNSIIGRDIIPVDVLPTTNVVTQIYYGDTDCAIVHFISGQVKKISFTQLTEFVTEKNNPSNAKQISEVIMKLSSLQRFQGIKFFDTPGLGSIFVHNDNSSMELLPKVGAAIIVVSVDSPLSENDMLLIKELAKYTPEVIILLTKADLVSESQLEEIMGFVQEQLVKHFNENINIFPFSIRRSFESYRRHIQEYILRHIAQRHEEESDKILQHKIRSVISSCKEYLMLARQAAFSTEMAKAELIELLRLERQNLKSIDHEMSLLAIHFKTWVRTAADEQFQQFRQHILAHLKKDLHQNMKQWKGNLLKTTHDFEKWIKISLAKEQEFLFFEGGEVLLSYISKAQSSFTRIVRAFQDRLSQHIEKALRTSFTGAHFQPTIAPPTKPDIRISKVFDMNVDLLWFLIPMSIFRPLIYRHFMKMLPWEVEKNLYRLSAQWAEAINNSIENLARQSQDFIEKELATLDRLLASTDEHMTQIQSALCELESLS